MKDIITYESAKGNIVSLIKEEYDYEVLINGMPIVNTGDEAEAEMIAESLDIALNLLDIQKRLK